MTGGGQLKQSISRWLTKLSVFHLLTALLLFWFAAGAGGAYAQSFTISGPQSPVVVWSGGPAIFVTITVTVSGGGSTSGVALSSSNVPTGLTVNPPPCWNGIPTPNGGTCSVTISAQSTLAAGTYTITITGTNSSGSSSITVPIAVGNFSLSASTTALTLAPGSSGPSTITNNGDLCGPAEANVSLSYSSAPSGVTVNFGSSSLTPSCAPGSSTTATFFAPSTPGGPYTVTITGTVNTGNGSVTRNVIVNVTVPGLTPSISIASSGSPSIYGSPVTLTATVTSGDTNTVTFYNGATSIGTATPSGGSARLTTSSLPAGSDSITASIAAGGSYGTATSTAITQTVNPASQSITVTTAAPSSQSYNGQFTVAATATSGLPVSYVSAGSCINSGSTYTMSSGSGTCTVTFSQAGNSNYTAASNITETVSATPASQSITVTTIAPPSKAYNGQFSVAATASSGLSVSYSSSGSCTNNGSTYTITSPSGTCTVTFSQAGNSNYAAASNVNETVTATASGQSITVTTAAPASEPYNGQFTVAATATSGLPVSYASSGSCTNSGGVYTMNAPSGACTVTFSQAGNSNYAAATNVTETVNAVQATPTISISDIPSNAVYGGSFTVTYSYSGNGSPAESVASSTTSVCTVLGNAVNFVGLGQCTLTASAGVTVDYTAVTGSAQSFTVSQATPNIAISNIPASATCGGGFTATYNYSGNGSPTESAASTTTNVCTVSGSTVTYVGAGICTLTASATATTDYTRATGQAQSFSVGAGSPLITTTSLPAGTQNSAYSATLQAECGHPSYTWSSSGNMPNGLSLNGSTGAITGIPMWSGTDNISVIVTDSSHATSSATLSINVGVGGVPNSQSSVTYTYDSQGRIYTAKYTTPNGTITVTYSYDSAGNRTSVVTQ